MLEAIVASTATIVGLLGGSLFWLGRKFGQIDERFKRIDERLELIDKKFEEIDGRFEEIKGYVDDRVRRLGNVFMNYQEFFVEYLASEGIIRNGQRELLRNEVRRLLSLGLPNPLRKEEIERARELVEKDELTLEEALELRELARKIAWEIGTPDAWRLHIYASIMVGLAIRKKMRKEEGR